MNAPLRHLKSWGRGRAALVGSAQVTARASLPIPRAGIERHLILAYRPNWLAVSDLTTIARHVREIDPTIETFVLPATFRNAVTRRAAAKRPTLVVSHGVMPSFVPLRGKVYQGSLLPKVDELRRLAAAGVPVPRWEVLRPDLQLDPAVWGEFVILKPLDRAVSSFGRGVQLMRTHRVRYRDPKEYPVGHPGRVGPMLVQQFVDTGEHVTISRVLTLFGEPLYALADRATASRISLAAPDEEIEAATIASQAVVDSEGYFIHEQRFLDLARAAHEAIPEVPLKGCDIIQDSRTGQLYVLETNCGGNTWHFSSAQQARERDRMGPEFHYRRHTQFDAFRTAARVLAARTVAEAV